MDQLYLVHQLYDNVLGKQMSVCLCAYVHVRMYSMHV